MTADVSRVAKALEEAWGAVTFEVEQRGELSGADSFEILMTCLAGAGYPIDTLSWSDEWRGLQFDDVLVVADGPAQPKRSW